ncbi:arylsulfatase [Reichenbachiella carrageenanivorans]|uniref:Arylsulfatase n=1 Tax=Reichenbachiella carrageenanivorans TaxID=2979869 RepID=A0ABY6D149_9BACT|nr:arylsulfatase [Reichenbachiella carrageenanivorans]UXX79838.1 arylsulfatase [Reichenbachiella carrageenanivorans]
MKYFLNSYLAMFVFASACADKPASAVDDKPNVIIVITDDQGYGDLGHTGNSIIQTPAIDKFASESVSLTNYHVGTTCAPTRAGFMTGRNCNRNGVWHTIMGASMLNKGEVTMADVFKENGYATGMFGKWHLGDNHPFRPHDRGFEEAFYHGGGGVGQTPDYWNNDYFDDTYFRNGVPEKQIGYCTDVWFDEAMKFIENKKEEPFFCYLSLNAPHGPYNVPKAYYEQYKDETAITEMQKRFYGMITNIDDNFARLTKQLNDLGIADNTILIFTTDNGTARGYKQDKKTGKYYGYNAGMRGTKSSEYDGGHRVPFIIKWPNGGLTGGKKLTALTAHVDLLPTLTTLTGQEFNSLKTLDGTDISDYLLGKSDLSDRYLVTDTQRVPWPVKGKNSCVMEGDWRLINGVELYNVSEDPGQENNLADQFSDRVLAMNAFYETWWEDVIKETKFSVIELGQDSLDVITCHDARAIDKYPPWNQSLIRKGAPMEPAKFTVNFVADGKYQFDLMRWPEESGLALGTAVYDTVPATAYTDKRIAGEAMRFQKAYLKIGDAQYETTLNNDSQSATMTADVALGETELLAYFDMEDGTSCNAFYVYVRKMDE